MCSNDYDAPSIYNETDPVARKNHICSECARLISIGEKYRNHFGVWGGKGDTFKTCSHCLIAQNYIREKCGNFLHGALEDDVFYHLDSMKNSAEKIKVYRLLVGIRRGWRKFKINELMRLK